MKRYSYGVCCVTKDGKQALLVQKAWTYAFSAFVSGKYQENLIELFNKMTAQEKELIKAGNFEAMYFHVFDKKIENYDSYLNIFDKLDLEKIKPLMDNTKNGVLLWEIPKGSKDKKETPRQTAIREFEEETGLKPINYSVPVSNPFTMTIVDDITYITEIFPGKFCNGNIKTNFKKSSEIIDIGWFTLAEAKKKVLPELYTQLIKMLK